MPPAAPTFWRLASAYPNFEIAVSEHFTNHFIFRRASGVENRSDTRHDCATRVKFPMNAAGVGAETKARMREATAPEPEMRRNSALDAYRGFLMLPGRGTTCLPLIS